MLLWVFWSQHNKYGHPEKGAIDAAIELFPFKSTKIKGIRRKVLVCTSGLPSIESTNPGTD